MATGTNQYQGRQLGPYAVLLAALFALITVVPFLPGGRDGGLLQRVAWTALILASLLIAGRTRWPLRLALAVSLPMLISRWLSLLGDFPALDIGMPVIHAAFLALTVFLIVRQIFAERSVGLDQVLAGINAYLLLGVAFSQLHIAVEAAAPGAYQLGDTALSQVAAGTGGISQIFMYFSFTTLTTLGYGDIRPVGEFARILCTSEALVGQLFVAVLIARLVSDYARRPREAA